MHAPTRRPSPILTACAALLLAMAPARAEYLLVFSQTMNLPDAGLTVKLMPDAAPRPLPPATTYAYRLRRGNEERTVDLYSPLELWRRSQHIGAWADAHGNALALAAARARFPASFPSPHMQKDDIEAALQGLPNDVAAGGPAAVRQWYAQFTGASEPAAVPVTPLPRRFTDLLALTSPDHPRRLAYAFRFNRRQLGLTAAPDAWYAVMLDVAPDTDFPAAREALLGKFLASLAPYSGSGRTMATPGGAFQDRRYEDNARAAPQLEQSRREAEESIRNMKGWWCASTLNYVMLSNLGTSQRALVRELQADLEALRAAYERLIPARAPITAASIVRVFATGPEYEAYVPPEQRWTSGLWVPQRGELVIRPAPEDQGRAEERARVLRAAYHESFHQYLHFATGRREAAAWFNEGHAALFEAAEVSNRRAPVVGEDPVKAQRVEAMARAGRLDLDGMFGLPYAGFYGASEERRADHYSLAWGLAYYLRKAAPLENKAWARIPEDYIEALCRTDDPQRATRAALANVDLNAFAREFASFWESSRRRRAAEKAPLFEPRR